MYKHFGVLKKFQPTGDNFLNLALIIFCLNKIDDEDASMIRYRAVKNLLMRKDENWLFGNIAGINFCVLSALTEYDPELIDGAALAKILKHLTSLESEEGGPYYTFVPESGVQNNIDLGVNVNIAYFLSLQGVELASLNNLIEVAIATGNFKSSLYSSPYFVIYFISKFYKGDSRQKLLAYILENKSFLKNDLCNTALAVIAAINLGCPLSQLAEEIKFLETAPPGPALASAFCVEALSKIKNTVLNADSDLKNAEIEEQKMLVKIINTAEERFSFLNSDLKTIALREIQRTVAGNYDKQMSLMPYYFRQALGEKGQIFSDGLIAVLGLANTFFWTAFIIYDNFWDEDEEAMPEILPAANLYAREFTYLFNGILPPESGMTKFFRELMDKLDGANTWETRHCRLKREGAKVFLPAAMSDFGDYTCKYEPPSAHILGCVVIMYLLGYPLDSAETRNLISYFKNYLIPMQMNDDLHDWKEDLERGHISTVVAMLLEDFGLARGEIDLEKDMPELEKTFWFKTLPRAGELALSYTNKSRTALLSLDILENLEPLEKYIIRIESSIGLALKEQKMSVEFLRSYQ
ncbi:MAG: hypothetical protein WC526_03750 [Patescibacteria group bacterium]